MWAVCGVGKTEFLLSLLPQLDGVCVAFPTHRLAREAYERYQGLENSVPYFLWPERPVLPAFLQLELDWNDRVGLSKTQAIFETALENDEVEANKEWKSEISNFLTDYEQIKYQSHIFCTHEKAIRLIEGENKLIKTFIFDEDPMKTLFKIDEIRLNPLCQNV